MNTYKDYLLKNNFSEKSIPTYLRTATRFKVWCKNYGTTPETVDYKTFLRYVGFLREGNLKARTLKGYVGSLKVYFDYLQQENYRPDNVVENINIKGIKKQVIQDVLDADQLEDLYYSYATNKGNTLCRKRNKVMLGLLVYQGITVEDLHKLQTENLQPSKGRVDIPGTRKSNGRVLELKAWQVMGFIEYQNEIHPEILRITKKHTEQLFIPLGSSLLLHNSLQKLKKELKQINQKFTGFKQLRSSVLVHWLKQYGLRKVQYMAGHRYISSTERYRQDDLESLHEAINQYHPMR